MQYTLENIWALPGKPTNNLLYKPGKSKNINHNNMQ